MSLLLINIYSNDALKKAKKTGIITNEFVSLSESVVIIS